VDQIAKHAASQIEGFGDLDELMKSPIPMESCGISNGFRVALNVMYRHPDNVHVALLANANAGGDNTSRGFVIGAVMGASIGDIGFAEGM
jgi:hypothetical protein